MQTKSLSMKRALSIALFTLLITVVGTNNALSQNQVATLQHEGNISVFFGVNALGNAHTAAVDGDTITLSSGNFKGCGITKGVMIHGAGCVEDTVAGLTPTTITTDLSYSVNSIYPLSIEGCLFNNTVYANYNGAGNNNVVFIKCNINILHLQSHGTEHLQLMNCIIKDFYFSGCDATFVNSVAKLNYYNQTSVNNINNIYNSILICDNNIHLNNSTIYNSIIATGTGNSVTSSTFYNCVGIYTADSLLFDGQVNNTNIIVDSYNDVFQTFDGTITYENSYQLKPDFANSFPGNDGTEVGIYGGMMPYNSRPTYMIVKKATVAGRTTADDKLGVEIELNNSNQ